MKNTLQFLILLIFIGCSKYSEGQTKNNSIKYFEETNFKNIKEEYIQKQVNIKNQKIDIDLSFDNLKPNETELTNLNQFLTQLEKILLSNENRMKIDFKKSDINDSVSEYISHHLQEISEKELSKIIDINDKSKSNEEKLFEKLKIRRIGIYPQDKFQFAVFDYTIGTDYTQYLLCIKTDSKGKILEMTIES